MPRFRSHSTSTPSTPSLVAPPDSGSAPTVASPVGRSGTASPNTLLSRGFHSLRRARRRSVTVPTSPELTDLQQRQNASPFSLPSSSSSLKRSPLATQINTLINTGEETVEPSHSDGNGDAEQQQEPQSATNGGPASSPPPSSTDSVNKKRIRLVPNIGIGNRCFVFDVIERDLLPGEVIKIGRYSDRNVAPDRLSFKSKVVSRVHAELWTQDGKVYLRDIGSSSGTFVGRKRLAAAGQQSTPEEIQDGDIVQLGVDYQGGVEPVYRAVRMRVEINRVTPKPSQPFSRQAFQQLRQHLLVIDQPTLANNSNHQSPNTQTSTVRGSPMAADIQECCICLYAIAPLQALFITPCSHTFHFKCIRPILFENYPGFSCPICRTYADLEASVAVEASDVLEALGQIAEGDDPKVEEEEKEDVEIGVPLQQVETVHGTDQDPNLNEVDIVPPLLEEDEEQEEQGEEGRIKRPPEEQEEPLENQYPSTASHHRLRGTSSRSTEGLLSSTLVATPPAFEDILSAPSDSPRS